MADETRSTKSIDYKNREKGKNASSIILSDDDDGLESEVIYYSNDTQMNQVRRYEEFQHDDPSGKSGGQEDSVGQKPKRVKFYRNGDKNYVGKDILISRKYFANFEALLIELSETIHTPTGVKFIFTLQGKPINTLQEFENGHSYVVASAKPFLDVGYGGSAVSRQWQNSKLQHNERHLFNGKNTKVEKQKTHSASNKQPIKISIIGNLKRDSRHIMLLNPQAEVNFEDILEDVPSMVHIEYPPVMSLWTVKKPMEKVESFSNLTMLYKNNHREFFAVGQEGVPMEMDTVKRKPLVSSESDDSLNDRRKYSGGRGGQNDGLKSSSMATNGLSRKGGSFKDKKFTDVARVTINGKPREYFPPSYLDSDDDGKKPDKKLKLDWVYGIRARDTVDNLKVLLTGELVYYVATVVVIYNPKNDHQEHYTGHNEEVTCLALHPNRRLIASGQLEGKSAEFAAHVRIWDGKTLSTLEVLEPFKAGINSVSFSISTEGEHLMVIDDSDRHLLSVWDWRKTKQISKTTTTSECVTSGCFYPDKELKYDIIITYGDKHLYFWKMFWDMSNDRGAICKILRDTLSGGGSEHDKVGNVTSLAFANGDVISGHADGSINVWKEDSEKSFIFYVTLGDDLTERHKRAVNTLFVMGDGTVLSGGGNELKAWDNEYNFKKEKFLPEGTGYAKVIYPQTDESINDTLYVATTKSCLLQVSLQSKFQTLIQGHSDEIWGIASHPKHTSFITAGHDRFVIKWSTIQHNIMWKVLLDKPCVSVAVDPIGFLVAVGTTTGRLFILRLDDGAEITNTQVGPDQINALSFSRDGRKLAVGTFDGATHIFALDEIGRFTRSQATPTKSNSSFVCQLDWDMDNRFVQLVLQDYEMVYWDVNNLTKRKDPRIMRDVQWLTQTCTVGHSLIGPWSNLADKEVINVAGRSTSKMSKFYVVVGDNRGRIRIYKYPSSTVKAQFRNVKVYSNNVSAITFTPDESYVLSSGGGDAGLIQWTVTSVNVA